jgi:hypothetical protein
LDEADVDILLEQIDGEAVPQSMRVDALADAGGFLNRAMELP